jgi:hypothetical protein
MLPLFDPNARINGAPRTSRHPGNAELCTRRAGAGGRSHGPQSIEETGPPAGQPRRLGFGTALIRRIAKAQLYCRPHRLPLHGPPLPASGAPDRACAIKMTNAGYRTWLSRVHRAERVAGVADYGISNPADGLGSRGTSPPGSGSRSCGTRSLNWLAGSRRKRGMWERPNASPVHPRPETRIGRPQWRRCRLQWT